jgi:hypothetical protein
LISFAFGLFLVYDIGFADGGLFTDNPNGQPDGSGGQFSFDPLG